MQPTKILSIRSILGSVFTLAAICPQSAAAAISNHAKGLDLEHAPRYQLSLAVSALFPTASNLNYVIYNKGLPLQSPSWEEKEVVPGYSPGFELSAAYMLTETNDISIDWTHLYNASSASISAPDSSYFLGPDYEIGPSGIPIRDAYGRAIFKYDVINLSVGQSLHFGEHTGARVFAGLSNTYLREQVNATYTGNTTGTYTGPFSTQQFVTANFSGLGPRIGVEANYMSGYGVGFFGEAAAAALIGSVYSKTAYISSAQQLLVLYGQTSNAQTIRDTSSTQIIPGFDTKLGLNWNRKLKNNVFLNLQLGYQAALYVNAISQYLPASLVAGSPLETGGIFVATMSHTLSNYSVAGPFLRAEIAI